MIVRRKQSIERILRQVARQGIGAPATPLPLPVSGEGALVELEVKGEGTVTEILVVFHKLVVAPTSIQLTAVRSEAGTALAEPVVISGSVTDTQFKVRVLWAATVPAGTKIPVYWRAEV